jgi:dipeptidyl aminopeptidase/acylaminoacyl peptidase
MNKKVLLILFCFLIIGLIFNGTSKATTNNFDQDVSKLDKKLNGKIISVEKVTFSEDYFEYSPIKKTPSIDNTVIYNIKYLSDNLEVAGSIIKPKKKGNYPVIIFNRGGNRELGRITKDTQAFLSPIASKGYVIVGSQYRGNAGGKGNEEFGGQEINDVLNLVPLIKSLDFTIVNNIFMLGFSRGGMMSYIAIKEDIDVNAAAVLGGKTDLIETYNNRPDMRSMMENLIGCPPDECKEKYIKRSAYYWPDKIDIPVLILHGQNDSRVGINQAKKLAEKLNELDKSYKLKTYQDGHSLSCQYDDWTNEMYHWFDKYRDQIRKI